MAKSQLHVSESSARAWEKQSRETRETRAAARERREKNLFSCLSHLAPSVTRVAICVSGILLDGLQKKRDTARSLLYNGHLEDRRKWPL